MESVKREVKGIKSEIQVNFFEVLENKNLNPVHIQNWLIIIPGFFVFNKIISQEYDLLFVISEIVRYLHIIKKIPGINCLTLNVLTMIC